jgi:hypothetical protein
VFLFETRQHKDRVSNFRYRISFKSCFVVDGVGKGGGLGLYWDESIKVDILSYGLHHIDCFIWSSDLHTRWRTTFVYGEPWAQDRHLIWELLHWLDGMYQSSWMVLGDFNEVQWDFEHLPARHRPDRQMAEFCEILAHCDLHDLGLSSLPWTYDNMQKGSKNVRVRLDRAVASLEWTQLFPSAWVQHIVSSRSDHCPILLELDKGVSNKVCRIFRYEIMWEREESLHGEIAMAWESVGQVQTLRDVSHALTKVRTSLKQWSLDKFGSITKELKKL